MVPRNPITVEGKKYPEKMIESDSLLINTMSRNDKAPSESTIYTSVFEGKCHKFFPNYIIRPTFYTILFIVKEHTFLGLLTYLLISSTSRFH